MRVVTWTAIIPAIFLLIGVAACDQSHAEAGTQAPGQPLASNASDNAFSPTVYSIAAGVSYTMTMSNSGDAIHNWQIIDAKCAGGKDIATELTAPHKASVVTFSITRPGVYHFVCDVHPDTMKGTIAVIAP
jgi:plastocyanin